MSFHIFDLPRDHPTIVLMEQILRETPTPLKEMQRQAVLLQSVIEDQQVPLLPPPGISWIDKKWYRKLEKELTPLWHKAGFQKPCHLTTGSICEIHSWTHESDLGWHNDIVNFGAPMVSCLFYMHKPMTLVGGNLLYGDPRDPNVVETFPDPSKVRVLVFDGTVLHCPETCIGYGTREVISIQAKL